ncbi:variant-specific surface protein VSP4A1-like [Toxorhynchites rutilus septentrionalis]|uniref:variant-specific surface protein VSP4A1-like n=1 Tax=Toxorhynchites rutilus septentrionalis TaxID=329112 RepID=UPI002479A825|nr:variant-specific surface protein VSP4A1-like [Toxorhynchites rutilus septentrionalis]
MKFVFFLSSFVLLQLLVAIEATSCVSCHSVEDPKCVESNYTTHTKDCNGANPCAVSIIAQTGHTFRGCAADPECYDNELCETCDGESCNSGVYPPDRRSCVECSLADANCRNITNPQQFSEICRLHFDNDACVTLFDGYDPATRGCLSSLEATEKDKCDIPLGECVLCAGDNCNVVNVRPDEKCLQCDSRDVNCKNATHDATACREISSGKCYSKILTSWNSAVEQDYGTTKRGCFSELSSTDIARCFSPYCAICSGQGCNRDQLIVLNSCKTCTSELKPACVRDPFTVADKKCSEGDNACATVINATTGHLFRGCSTERECVDAGDDCVKCDAYRNCNFLRYPEGRLECSICETSHNARCATLPYDRQFWNPCLRHFPEDQCVTIFDGFRVVRRECMSGIDESDRAKCDGKSSECVVCSGVYCNKITVRKDDSCLQCTSDAPNCANGLKVSTVCSTVSDGICYNRLDEDGKLHRGCLSDLNEEQQEQCQDPSNTSCVTCSGEGCNKSQFPVDGLRCVECHSEKDPKCAQQQDEDSMVAICSIQLSDGKCFTRLNEDGTVDRGCSTSLNTPCDSEHNVSCVTCEGSTCNNYLYPENRRFCFQCNALYDKTCGLGQNDTSAAMVCRRYAENDKCYTLLEHGNVTRGCASDFDVDICQGLERTQCQICDSNHCNSISEVGLRSVATKYTVSVLYIIQLVLIQLIIIQ